MKRRDDLDKVLFMDLLKIGVLFTLIFTVAECLFLVLR